MWKNKILSLWNTSELSYKILIIGKAICSLEIFAVLNDKGCLIPYYYIRLMLNAEWTSAFVHGSLFF